MLEMHLIFIDNKNNIQQQKLNILLNVNLIVFDLFFYLWCYIKRITNSKKYIQIDH